MRIKVILFSLIVALCVGFVMWDLTKVPSQVSSVPNAEAPKSQFAYAPDVTFASLDGNEHKLTDFKGRVVLLNFWASWCAPCIVEFPLMLELARDRADEVVFIAMSVDAHEQDIHDFFDQLDPVYQDLAKLDNVLIVHDVKKEISLDVFQTAIYPETYIIGPDMKIVEKIVGLTDWLGPEISALIDTTLDRSGS